MYDGILADMPMEQKKQYFASGWTSFKAFYESQDWTGIYCAEASPETALINGRIKADAHDLAAAKGRALAFAAERVAKDSTIYLEFGVRAGISMKHMAKCLRGEQHELHGFDTFTGLPDGWLPAWGGHPIDRFREVGEMAVSKIPEFYDKRIAIHKGLFQETLPSVVPLLNAFKHRFVNIDCDAYSGALYTLTQIHYSLQKGDILYFDEFHDELNEYAAFNDYVRAYCAKDRFKLIARAYDAYCFEVL